MKCITAASLIMVCAALPCAGAPPAEPGALERCRPRLFFRPDAWAGGRSVGQLRELAKASPFKERLRLLRTTRANLALKWLITGDEAAAAEALRGLKELSRDLKDSEDGVQLLDAALAYDWLYGWEGFAAPDRKSIEDCLLALAARMRDQLAGEGAHVFHTRMYAWTAAVGLTGLALHDVRPEGAELFEYARRYYEERLMPARALQDGAMHNGLSYGPNYMMLPLLQFLKGARSGANRDYFHTARAGDSDWLRATAPYLIHSVRPDFRHVMFADASTSDPAKHFRFMLDILAAEYRDGYAADLARRISEHFTTSGYHAEWIYLFFAFHDPTVAFKPVTDMPTFRVFSPSGVGQAFFRSDWTDSAMLVHFRCGDYFEDHGHFDQGSFTLYRRGDLALKGGGYWGGFDSDHRHRYFKQAISANTVIFSDPSDPGDEGQQRQMHYQSAGTVEDYLAHKKPGSEPCVETGDIVAADDPAWAACTSTNFHHLAADVTAAWDASKVKRFVRQVAFVDGRHLVVVDETETARPGIRARWLLHSMAEPTARDAGPGAWEVRLPQSVLFVQPLIPAAPRVTLIGGKGREYEVNGVNHDKSSRSPKDAEPDVSSGAWRMELESPQPEPRRLFVTLLTADDPNGSPPAASALMTNGVLVVRVAETETRFLRVR